MEENSVSGIRGTRASGWNSKGGVPQGTLIGPLGFVNLVNDAATGNALMTLKYVDDLSLIETRSRDKPPVVQDHLDKFSDWVKNNHMKLNPSKCAHMKVSFLKKQDEDHALTIDQVPLQEISTTKVLGVHVSSDLKWSNHIYEVLKKANWVLQNSGKLALPKFRTVRFQHSPLLYMTKLYNDHSS